MMRHGRGGGREQRPGVSKDLPPVSARRLFSILWPYRGRLALSGLLMLYTAGVGLVFPLVVTALAWKAATIRGMMSATGLLYIALGLLLAGEVLARGLLFTTGAAV